MPTVASGDSLRAIFSAPTPAGPITNQAADAIAFLLWAAARNETEDAAPTKNPGISAATDPG